MARQFVSPVEVGPTHGLYNKGMRVGNVVFVSGQVPWNQAGEVVGIGDIEAQATQVFENMRIVLEAAGASFSDVVSTTTYLTNVLYRPAVNEARQRYGLTNTTNTSIIVSSLVMPEFLLEVRAIAVVGEDKQRINPPGVHDVTGRYVHAIRAGNTIYVSGQVGWDADGNVAGKGDPVAQAEQLFTNMERVLAAVGASFDDVVNTTSYLTNISYRPALAEARARRGLTNTTSTLVVCSGLAVPELLMEVSAIAVVDQDREIINPPGMHDPTGRYVHAIKTGNTVYISGQVAADAQGNVVGLGDPGAQAVKVFENMQTIMEAAGGTLADVANTTTYMTNLLFRPPVNQARQSFGMNTMTNSSLIISSLAQAEYLTEVEAIAVLNEE